MRKDLVLIMMCLCLQRRALLRRLRLGDLDDAHTAYIFTEVSNRYKNTCLMHAQKPSLDYWNAVHDTYRPFISIVLTCEVDEIIERLRSPDRFTNNKPWPLSNSPHYDIDEKERLFEFGTSRELKLDISYLSPESAAECIRDHIEGEKNPFALGRRSFFYFSSPAFCFISSSPPCCGHPRLTVTRVDRPRGGT
jgi:hypothetical protein